MLWWVHESGYELSDLWRITSLMMGKIESEILKEESHFSERLQNNALKKILDSQSFNSISSSLERAAADQERNS